MVKNPQINRLIHLKKKLENTYNNKVYVDTRSIKIPRSRLNHVDLFSGAGGNMEGLKQAGFDTLLSVEIDPDASATLRKNFPNTFHFEKDIQKIHESEIRQVIGNRSIHILTAGFPCQGFSIAGCQNINDARNTLYKQVVRFAKLLKPKFVVMENVPGIINMNDGKFIDNIKKSFEKIGYPDMSILILESANYGIAQIRPRAIFIVNRINKKNPYPLPLLKTSEYLPIENALVDLEKLKRDPKINHEWTKHKPDMIKRISKICPGESLYSSYVDSAKKQYVGVPSMTVKENHGCTHIHYKLNRMISVREMARLQSFPDSFIFSGRMKRAMWQVGNAAPPLLFKHIGKAIISQL